MTDYQFTTATGSVYRLEDRGLDYYLTRMVAGEDRELRRDGEAIRVLAASEAVIGRPMGFKLDLVGDGTITTRTTSALVSWEEI